MREGLEPESRKAVKRRHLPPPPPHTRWDRAGMGCCRPVAVRPGPQDLPPSSSFPVHLHPAAIKQLPLEGADHCRELLAPLWSQSREVSWAKRQPEAAFRHHEFTDFGSSKSGLKPCTRDQPPALQDLCLQTAEPSHIWTRARQGDSAVHQDLKDGIWTRTRSSKGGL